MTRSVTMNIDGYKVHVRDYRYKSRPPVGVTVTGSRVGEARNPFGEPCYFFQSADALSMAQGIAIAKGIIASQKRVRAQ